MIHYDKAGNGEPLVLIHGFCENNTCFNKQVLLLKEHCTVITLDLPGAGKSASTQNTSVETMADAVAQLLETLHITEANIIGHSMGGYVTLAMAKKYPDLVKRFGLLHSTAKPDDDARKLKRDQAALVIKEKGAHFYASNFIPPLFNKATQPQLIKPYVDVAETFTTEGLTEALMAMKNRPDSIEFIKNTTKPTFWGIGKYDEIIPEQVMLEQALMAKQSYLAYFSKSGHMAHIEEPKLLAKHLLNFIQN